MRINSSAATVNTQRQLNTNSTSKSAEKLFSGQTTNKTTDNAATLTVSEKMRSQIRGLSRASSNAQDDISLIQSATSALEKYTDTLRRIRELAVQGSDETINTRDEYDAINAEVTALNEQLNHIIEVTQFNGKNLFTDEVNTINYLRADSNSGDVAINQMLIPDMTIDPPDYSISDAEQANSMISAMDETIATLDSLRYNLSALQSRLEATVRNFDTISENIASSKSRIRDVDTAKQMMEFIKSNIVSQSSTVMLAQANQLPQNVLHLL